MSSSDRFVDAETNELLIKRDPAFLKSLFVDINPFLIRVCIANSIYSENADDIIHQTWETFLTNLEKFQGRSQIRTFICGILFNKIREHRRIQGTANHAQLPTAYRQFLARAQPKPAVAAHWTQGFDRSSLH